MGKNRLLFISMIICLLGLCLSGYANREFYFRHFGVEKGLSNNSVTSILQDKTGFLWIGTKDGLNRFDGYSFKAFRSNGNAMGAIGSNFIHTLYEDKQGELWIGTEGGLFAYNEKTETFRLISSTANQYITQIKGDHLDVLWLLSSSKLYSYRKSTNRLENLQIGDGIQFTKLCVDTQGTLWAGTTNGLLLKYDADKKSFTHYNLFNHSGNVSNRWIESLYCTEQGLIVAGTSNKEIKLFDPQKSDYSDITIDKNSSGNLYIRCVLQANEDELWLGTEYGLFIYNSKTGQTNHVTKDYNDPYALKDNAIYSLFKDREGGIWVGTYFGGLNYLPVQLTPFTKYYPQKNTNAITGSIVREIRKDGNGNLWIGTEDAGINRLNLQTGKFTNYQPSRGGFSTANIHGLMVHDRELWVGTFHKGLDVIDIRTGKITKHFSVQNGSGFTHDFIYGIYTLSNDRIIATSPHGAFQFNPKEQKFDWFKGLPQWIWYTGILEDHSGVIWAISFGNGVHYFDPKTGESGNFRHHSGDPASLSNDRVNSVFEDSNHQLWFTTDEGLCKFNKSTKTFTRYGTKDGFPSDFMFSMLEDSDHRLWISTTKGLVCFKPGSGSSVQVYTTQNGLLSDQFNYNSAFKDTDGRMYFGSTGGMISFNPTTFRHSNFVVPVVLTSFHINNNEQLIGRQSNLPGSITYTNEITLTHDQSTFSINFASLSFTVPDLLHYSYQMEGLSENWVNIQTSRWADFVGLRPGSYTFHVKATRSDGIESKVTHLKVTILPPWWQSSLAYFTYGLLTFILLLFTFKRVDSFMKEKQFRKMELLKIENEKQLLEEKIHFFTNVAHEIKTPLTLIKVPLAKVMKKTIEQPDVQNSLNIMSRNTDRLLELSNQLLDFRQTEIGKFKISLKKTDISKLVTDACQGFSDLANEKTISFSHKLPPQPFFAYVDEDAFNKIIYNLFSNAVKYASQKVSIALIPHNKDHQSFTIEVKNDGYRIPAHLNEKIFEAFYRLEETAAEGGSGIGLALAKSLAELHNGNLTLDASEADMNVFSLTLPIEPASLSNE